MDQHRSELHSVQLAHGPAHRRQRGQGVPDRDHPQQRHLPHGFGFLQKREWEWGAKDRLGYLAASKALDRTPARLARQIFHSVKAPHRMTSVQAGEVEAVHALTTERVWEQQGVAVEGQTDILTMGLPYISPYNVNSILNPILVACLGLGYFFNLYRGKPLVREGGVLIMTHPTPWEFNPVHHPSYIDFFEQVLTETTDPIEMSDRFEESFATDPWYIHLYRTGHAYHGVHPFYMWYWCAHALQHLGASDHRRRRPRGRPPARVPRRLHPGRRAGDGPGRGGPVALADPPPRATDPDGRRPVTAERGSSNSLRPRRAVPSTRPSARAPVTTSPQSWRRSALSARWLAGRPGPVPPGPPELARIGAPARPEPELGVHYDTDWSRRYPVRLARAMVLDNVTRPWPGWWPPHSSAATRACATSTGR